MLFSSSAAKGQDCEKLLIKLEATDFINIETKVLDDVITGWITKDREVGKASVNGDCKYSADAQYLEDIAIVVTYHAFLEKKESIEYLVL